jgi:hypothetical protein
MSEEKIVPERWEDIYDDSENRIKQFGNSPMTISDVLVMQLIEELGAAEQERDASRTALGKMAGAFHDDTARLKSERDALKAEVERLRESRQNAEKENK